MVYYTGAAHRLISGCWLAANAHVSDRRIPGNGRIPGDGRIPSDRRIPDDGTISRDGRIPAYEDSLFGWQMI